MHNQWDVELSFEEDGVNTACDARLTGARAPGLSAHGESVKSADDRPLARIGEEMAASRALEELSRKLAAQATGEIDDEGRRPNYLIY
ncbi:dsRBD fold-containing protein [Streptomyces sp. NRRL WC-3742]|uniref:dsRBD fold-containing protein n=1 Tax=Streptomyces sp. NRRL WC-3742 TaxID=1463934 RepID=UPI0004C5C9A7|nr:dsRBD fold-containing protein [Streptomyces sp. NRRL WC-3742]